MSDASRKRLTGILLALVATLLFIAPFALNYARGGAKGVGYDPRTQGSPMFFAATYPQTVAQGPLDGRLVVVVSRQKEIEPRLLVSPDSNASQVFGLDVSGWFPGRAVELTDAVEGFPLPSLAYIRPGYYWMQGLFYRYETVRRPNLPPVQMPAWQQSWVLVSRPVEVYLDPRSNDVVRLDLARTLSVEAPRVSGDQVVRLKSETLSAFWGRDVYLEAAVDLPEGWSEGNGAGYPLIVRLGGGAASAPDAVVATLVHPAPYGWRAFDSDNLGPWGTSLVQELVPEIERRFRGGGSASSRALVGANEDGWQALQLALSHPDAFGGVWSVCPGPVDFHDYFGVDLYQDDNAFTETARGQEDHLESVLATRSRSGRAWDVWEAALSPLRADGYPSAIWNKRSGAVDAEVARQVRDRSDARVKLESEWGTLGPKLAGKLHVMAGKAELADSLSAASRLGAFLRSRSGGGFTSAVTAGALESCSRLPFADVPAPDAARDGAASAADALLPEVARTIKR